MTDGTEKNGALHLLRLPVDFRKMEDWAEARGWILPHRPSRRRPDPNGKMRKRPFIDDGVALHHLLTEIWGRGCVLTFRSQMPASGETGAVYMYSCQDAESLLERAELAARPEHLGIVDIGAMTGKRIPAHDRLEGRRIGFDLRVRPVRRIGRSAVIPGCGRVPEGGEIDLYAGRAAESGGVPSRAEVYLDWLGARLDRAASLETGRLHSFHRRPVLRGGGVINGPDAVLRGVLRILDGKAFHSLLSGGVGRHKAYGYGQLLLGPA